MKGNEFAIEHHSIMLASARRTPRGETLSFGLEDKTEPLWTNSTAAYDALGNYVPTTTTARTGYKAGWLQLQSAFAERLFAVANVREDGACDERRRGAVTDMLAASDRYTADELIPDQWMDPATGWSIGTFGAIAEFTRDADEPTEIDLTDGLAAAVTARGGLRIDLRQGLRPIASESLTRQSWSQRVALCLPDDACAMSRRTVLTEVGPDVEALRPEDRSAVLFDLGLGALQVDACIRTGDAAVVTALRAWTGRSIFDPGCGAMAIILAANPHRVFLSRLGRIEVFRPIPPPGGRSPSGPHTHLLPKLLRHRRTHAATEPLPPGWIPCAYFYPPHPARDEEGHARPFQAGRHAAFQALLDRYGDQNLMAVKQNLLAAVKAGRDPSAVAVSDRFARASVRIALRQLQAAEPALPSLAVWRAAHDRFDPDGADDSIGDHPCTA